MMRRPTYRESGMSLVELLIAVALSLILSLGIIQIFSSSKQTSRVQNALARIQENARFALDILSRDIRMAGQLGCNQDAVVIDSSNGTLGPFGSGIFGYDHSSPLNVTLTTTASDNPDEDAVAADTDAIVIMAASANGIPITAGANNQVSVAAAGLINDIDEGDPMLLSDCDTADLFIAGARAGDTLPIKDVNFSKTYSVDADAELARLNYTAYYLKDVDGERHLYRTYVNGETGSTSTLSEPLLTGVEDFQVLYGEDINGDGSLIRYVDATTLGGDMSNVVSVRIHLLLRTVEDNVAVEPQSHWFMGELVEPAEDSTDRHLYRNFTTTIKLRNQGIDT